MSHRKTEFICGIHYITTSISAGNGLKRHSIFQNDVKTYEDHQRAWEPSEERSFFLLICFSFISLKDLKTTYHPLKSENMTGYNLDQEENM